MAIPKVGDIITIKRDLSECNDIVDNMFQYQGRRAKVLSVMPCDFLSRYKNKVTFKVFLNVDGGRYYWYEDGLVMDPADQFQY